MKKLFLCGIVGSLLGINVLFADVPFKVDKYDKAEYIDYTFIKQHIKFTALEDSVTIKDIVVNRGNCEVFWKDKYLPWTIKYGQIVDFRTTCGDILEAQVSTNLGDYDVKF